MPIRPFCLPSIWCWKWCHQPFQLWIQIWDISSWLLMIISLTIHVLSHRPPFLHFKCLNSCCLFVTQRHIHTDKKTILAVNQMLWWRVPMKGWCMGRFRGSAQKAWDRRGFFTRGDGMDKVMNGAQIWRNTKYEKNTLSFCFLMFTISRLGWSQVQWQWLFFKCKNTKHQQIQYKYKQKLVLFSNVPHLEVAMISRVVGGSDCS